MKIMLKNHRLKKLSDREINDIIMQLKCNSIDKNGPAGEELLASSTYEWFERYPDILPPCYKGVPFPKCYNGPRKIHEWPNDD
jgi:hypothetical protein